MAAASAPAKWVISIVSHGHGNGVLGIINDVYQQLAGQDFRIILTQNIPEKEDVLQQLPEAAQAYVTVRQNPEPRGFGANHNAALLDQNAEFVIAADPDLRLPEAIFANLEEHLTQAHTGIASPRAVNPQGDLEDNGRPLFTPGRLINRYALGRRRNTQRNVQKHIDNVDWLAGLFLAMRQPVFQQVGGFDTNYFMYCEDIDLCLRIQQLGLSCELLDHNKIVHPPRRGTFRSLKHLFWHIHSLFRLWRSPAYKHFRQPPKTPKH